MPEQVKINHEEVLFKESFKGIKNDIRLTLVVLTACLLLALASRFIFGASIDNVAFLILVGWILFYISHWFSVKHQKNNKQLHNFHFKNNFIDLVFLTVIIHYLGSVEWIGAIFYLCILSWASSVLTKGKVLILCVACVFFYTELATLEYFGVIPHREVFSVSQGAYQDPAFILIQIAALIIAFFFIIENYGTLSDNLKQNQQKLVAAQGEIEESKNVLEIKIQARTKELQELTKRQEEIIKERTGEIQEKLEEMERFHGLAVGRELKMIELKKEIKKLEEKLK